MRAARALLLAVATTLVAATAAQLGGGSAPKVHPRITDLKYIRCQVCELLATNAWNQVEALKQAATPSAKVDEMMIIDKIEKMTTAWRPEGEWIAQLDLVEDGDKLWVVDMGQAGNCGVECKTIERAAEQIMGNHDTDIAEVLFTGKKNRSQFHQWLCYETTEVCKYKAPPLPKDREPGPPFQQLKEGDQNLDRMLGEMQDRGLKGNLFNREELMSKYGMPEGDKDDDDDDDVDDDDEENKDIEWHHIGGGKPPRTTVTKRVADGARGAAAAAHEGFAKARDKAKGIWEKFQREKPVEDGEDKDEL